jgi:uncharacterized protein (TIGR02186 family)
MKRAAFLLALAGVSIAAGHPAHGERLVSSLSTHQVLVTSSFTGTELVLFGSVERDAATVPRRGGYNLVVTVTGPRQTLVTRKKERVAGIWTNAQSRTFSGAPSYLAVLSNRPLDDIAPSDVMRRLELGLSNVPFSRESSTGAPDERGNFRAALIRLKSNKGLYREETNAVTFLTPNLFRGSITLPAEAPVGIYEVDLKLFADGTNIARTSSALEIIKVGVEQFVASAARDYSFLYGLGVVMIALVTGWLASIVFRRE